MLRAAAGLILITACTLQACKVDQRAEVESYRSKTELPDAPGLHPAPGEPLSIQQAARLTNAANEQLSIGGEQYLQAIIDRQRDFASLLPTVDLFGSLTWREKTGSGNSGNGSSSSSSETTLFDGGFGGQYTLFTGLTDFRRVNAADLTIEQQHWLLLDLRESLLLDTARAYYGVLLAERLVSVLESSLAVQEERLRDIRGRQKVGFARPLDVAQIESQASDTRVSLLDAKNAVSNTRAALSLLTTVDASALPLSDGFDPPAELPSADELLAIATAQRQDLAATAAAAAATRETVDAEIGRYYPTVTLNLQYFLTRDTIPTDRDWTSLLTLNLPIFSAGRIDADVRAAWSDFRRAVLQHSLTRRQIRRDIDVAYADLIATRARVEELTHQVAAAQEALRQAEAAYSAGLGTNLERITAQDQLLSAQLRSAREEYTAKIAYLAAVRATGGLTPVVTGATMNVTTLPPVRPVPDAPFVNLPASDPAAQ